MAMTTDELFSHFQGSVRNGAAFFILNILCQIELQPKFRLRDVRAKLNPSRWDSRKEG